VQLEAFRAAARHANAVSGVPVDVEMLIIKHGAGITSNVSSARVVSVIQGHRRVIDVYNR